MADGPYQRNIGDTHKKRTWYAVKEQFIFYSFFYQFSSRRLVYIIFGGRNTMSAYDRMEKKIDRLEHTIEKNQGKISELEHQLKEHRISEQKFHSKKQHIQTKIRNLDAQIRILKGGLVKRKHKLTENS